MRTVEGCSKCHRTLSIWRYEEPTQSRQSGGGGDCGVRGGVRTLSLRGSTALLANSLRQGGGGEEKEKKKLHGLRQSHLHTQQQQQQHVLPVPQPFVESWAS